MINHRKTKEIRNHRRLAIISDFSLLAPHVGLEPTTPCNNPTDSATFRQMGRPSGCYLLSIGGLCSDSREGIKKKGAAVGRTLLFGSSLYAHVEPRLEIHGFFSDGRCCFNYVCAAVFVANSSLTIRPRDFLRYEPTVSSLHSFHVRIINVP